MTAVLDRPVTAAPRTLPRGVAFAGISAAMVAILVAAGAPTPLLPIYQAQWGFPPWVLTLAFGAYAFALLVTIPVVGSLSDHVGRRPLMIGALALDLVAMVVFLLSPSVGWLITARVVQGVATAAASTAVSAAVVELAPERYKKLGAQMTSLAPLAGLGIGALYSGLLAQFASDAAFAVWMVLVVVMSLVTLVAVFTPETATRKPGALASLVPRISLPAQVRRLYATTVPGIVSAFMMMTLYMGLVPVVLVAFFHVHNPVVGALVAFVVFAVGAAVSAFSGTVRPHLLRVAGAGGITAGAVVFVGSIGAHSLALVWVAAVLTGAGIGAAFAGTTRGLVPEVAPHERAGLFTAVYVVGYAGMGVSAIAAGLVAGLVGPAVMASWFGVVTAVVALTGVIATTRLSRA